jgi:nanoRNase/pAp phosphatase (c-di-AMP/oligoRNAs hydrolase)
MTEKEYYREKITELKNRILPASSVLIVTHDYPDPDCIASAHGLQHLFKQWGVASTQITFGGFIGRAENRAMVRFLNIQMVPIMLIEYSDYERIIVVDSFPGDGNVSLPLNKKVDGVIDHHPHKNLENAPFFCDIRKEIGATSTLITQYLMVEECPFTTSIATSLFYGIKTDTNYLSRNVSEIDLDSYKTLFDLVDHRILSTIESPDRDAEYFRVLHRAAEAMLVYNDTIGFTHLGVVKTPDCIAEIADMFHGLENLEWMICSGIFKHQIFFSIRSKKIETAGINAENIAQEMNGFGGGHSTMSAGRIPVPLRGIPVQDSIQKFITTLKVVFDIKDVTGKTILK